SPSRSDRLTPQKLSTSCRSELVAISARPSGFRPGRGHDSPCFHRMRLFTKVLLPSVTEEWLRSSGAQDGEGNGLAKNSCAQKSKALHAPLPRQGKQKSYSLLRGEAGDGPP